MTIYATRCQIKDLASNVWKQLEAEGWESVMSRPEDGVMKKQLPTGPLFIRITPVIANSDRFTLGPAENYQPGTTGVGLSIDRTTPGLDPNMESFEISVADLPTYDGNTTLTIGTTPVIIPVYSGSVRVVAEKIRDTLLSDSAIAMAYDVIVDVNGKVIITAKDSRAIDFNMSITDTITGVTASDIETIPGITPVNEERTIIVNSGATVSGTLNINFDDGTIIKPGIKFPVVGNDTAAQVAGKIKTALTSDNDINTAYTITNVIDTNIITIASKTGGPKSITITITEVPNGVVKTIAETQIGVTSVAEVFDLTVTGSPITSGNVSLILNNTPVNVTVSNGDNTTEEVAAKIRNVLATDTDVSVSYTISGSGNQVIITKNDVGAVDLTIAVAGNNTGIGATFVETTPGDVSIQEVNTITVNSACTANGTINVFFGDGVINKTIDVNVVTADSLQEVASAIQFAVDALADYVAIVNDNVVTIAAASAESQVDATFNPNDTGTTVTINITQQGITGVKEINTLTITNVSNISQTGVINFNDGIINKSVNFDILSTDTIDTLAVKIAILLENDGQIGSSYTITSTNNNVIISRDATGAVDTVVTLGVVAIEVNCSITQSVVGVTGVAEVNTLTVLTGAINDGTISINLSDGILNKTLIATLNGADSFTSIVNRIRTVADALDNWNATVVDNVVTISSTLMVDNPDPTFDANDTGTVLTISVLAQGGSGSKEENTIKVLSNCTTTGLLQIFVSNGIINKEIQVSVTSGQTVSQVATAIKNKLTAEAEVTNTYDVTINVSNIDSILVTRKTIGPFNTTIKLGYLTGLAGTFTNDQSKSVFFASAVIVKTSPFNYKLYTFDDHIVLSIIAEVAIAGAVNALHYVGRLKLFGVEPNNTAVVLASTNIEGNSKIYPLKDKANTVNGPAYDFYSALPPSNPGGGGLYYMAPIEVGSISDGIRGEIDHVYAIPLSGVIQDDTITVGSQVYDIHTAGSIGYSSLAGTRAVAVYNRG